LASPGSVVLDVGCGWGEYADDPVALRRELRVFQGKVKRVVGIDVDENAKENPFIDEFHLVDESGRWPLEDNSVDLCLCDHIVEHIKDPDLFFSECRRVISAKGYLCIRTTNLASYVGLFSKLIPNRLHKRILSKVNKERKEEDIYPTFYKCNTIREIRRMLSRYGFANYTYGYEAEPIYLSFSRLSYWLGVVHQRFAPRSIKPTILAFGRKGNN
jgi:ubiquinone/menaquinone biosynthesis C-methylase UbiE